VKENVAVTSVGFVGGEEEVDVSVMLAEAKMEKLASCVGEGSLSIAVRNALMRSKADLRWLHVRIRLPVRSCHSGFSVTFLLIVGMDLRIAHIEGQQHKPKS
jgi:hypothetical protein